MCMLCFQVLLLIHMQGTVVFEGSNSASVWLAPPELDSPGVGVGAALKAALKGRFKGPFKGRNTAASADQLVVMRNYGIFGERRNFFRPPLRGAIHTEAGGC